VAAHPEFPVLGGETAPVCRNASSLEIAQAERSPSTNTWRLKPVLTQSVYRIHAPYRSGRPCPDFQGPGDSFFLDATPWYRYIGGRFKVPEAKGPGS